IQLRDDDYVVNGFTFDDEADENIVIITQRGACKRMAYHAIEKTNRARRGAYLLRLLKTKPHKIVYIDNISLNEVEKTFIVTDKDKNIEVDPMQLPVNERNSNGSFVLDEDEDGKVRYAYKDVAY